MYGEENSTTTILAVMAAALVAASGVALAKEFVGTERGVRRF
jgi:hypothetical protein